MRQFLEHVGLVDIRDKIVVEEGQIEELLNRMESMEVGGTVP
jgi:hypothetical protein